MTVASDMYLGGDVHNVLRGLAVIATALPLGAFRDGYEAALTAVAASFGMTSPAPQDTHLLQTREQPALTGWEDVDSGVFAWGNGS